MACNDFLHQILEDINETFESQNPELFDVIFEIEGKKLYADKLRLSVASPTFKIMLSDQWHSNKNEPIKITEYKFEDFKNFISFIYSGECDIHCDNAFVMTDIAEFYQIPYLKQLCDEYFSIPYYFACHEIVLKRIEISSKYSLAQTKAAVKKFVNENIYDLIKSDEFLNASKSNILELVDLLTNSEHAFAAGYQWSAYQAFKKEESSNDENFNMNEAIKAEIIEFLPYYDLTKMKKSFLAQHVGDDTVCKNFGPKNSPKNCLYFGPKFFERFFNPMMGCCSKVLQICILPRRDENIFTTDAKKYQRQISIVMTVEGTVPLFTMVLPMLFDLMTIVTGIRIPWAGTFSLMLVGMAPIINPIVKIFVISCYRKWIFKIFRIKKQFTAAVVVTNGTVASSKISNIV